MKISATQPSISVVMPFFNGNEYLRDALESIAANCYPSLELLIVVDMGSEMPLYSPEDWDFRVRVVRNLGPDSGAGVARYIGFNSASTQYVVFLDCDDVITKNRLKRQVMRMRRDEAAFSFGAWKHFKSSAASREYPLIIPRGPFTLDRFLKKNFTVGCLTVMVDKSQITEISSNALKRRNDYMLWFDIIRSCDRRSLLWTGYSDHYGCHRLHDGSLSSSKVHSSAAQYLFYRACGFSLLSSSFFWLHYAANTLLGRIRRW